jgi:hypothetical protein
MAEPLKSSLRRLQTARRWKCENKLYDLWRSVFKRCYVPGSPSYEYYGGHGVKMCARWFTSYKAFEQDFSPRPKDAQIGRTRDTGNYACGKCVECKKNDWERNGEWMFPPAQGLEQRLKNLAAKGINLPDAKTLALEAREAA